MANPSARGYGMILFEVGFSVFVLCLFLFLDGQHLVIAMVTIALIAAFAVIVAMIASKRRQRRNKHE